MHVVHHNTPSNSFQIRIEWFQPKQDSDRMQILFFINRIWSDSKKSLSEHLWWLGSLRFQRASVASLAVFPRIWAYFFVELRDTFFFEGLWVPCFWACFSLNLLVFLQISVLWIAFFKFYVLWYLCCFNLPLKAYWACFCEHLLILGLVFEICLLACLFNFLADFSFCWIVVPTHVGLVFQLNYLFFACF